MKTSRKGFTLVELLVVIAILAILATVSIVGYISFINRAHESNDSALVAQLNSLLLADETLNGKGKNRIHIDNALRVAEEGGYIVSALSPTSDGNYIIWNESTNRFELIATDKLPTSNAAHIWLLVDNQKLTFDEASPYSQYLNYVLDEDKKDLTVKAGIAVGENTNVNVNYESAEEATVSFLLNGGKLTVDNENAVVHSYGHKSMVDILAVDEASYHEWGTVEGHIQIANGRLVIESTSSVSAVFLNTDDASAVTLVMNSTKPLTLVGKEGVVSAVSVTGAGATNVTREESTLTAEALSKFAGGLGTKESPYLISTPEQWKAMGMTKDEFLGVSATKYYKLINDIDASSIDIYNMYGRCVIDGAGYNLTISSNAISTVSGDEKLFIYFKGAIKNINIVQMGTDIVKLAHVAYSSQFINITVSSGLGSDYIHESKYGGSFIHQTSGSVYFENCTSNVNMNVDPARNAGIFVRNYLQGNGLEAIFINCINNGNISGASIGFFTGNDNKASVGMYYTNDISHDNKEAGASIYIENCANYGKLIGTACCEPFAWVNSEANNADINAIVWACDEFYAGVMKVGKVNDMSLNLQENNILTITPSKDSSVTKYIITYTVSTSFSKDNNRTATSYFVISQEVSKDDVASAQLDFISEIILDIEYDKTAEVKYADIDESAKTTNERGYEYTIVTVGEKKIVVVSSESMLNERTDGANEVWCGSSPKYLITAQNDNNTSLGRVEYKVTDFTK